MWPRLTASASPKPAKTSSPPGYPHRRIAIGLYENGTLDGYGVLRTCIDGHKVGPLFARNETVALRLLGALATRAGGPVQIDVPLTQQSFVARLEAAGMAPSFSTTRMYRGPAPAIAQHMVFAVTTLELG